LLPASAHSNLYVDTRDWKRSFRKVPAQAERGTEHNCPFYRSNHLSRQIVDMPIPETELWDGQK